MTPPDDREFGRLEGKVEAIGEQITDLRASNTREHAAVVARFDRLEAFMRESLGDKADRDWVADHERQIDSLKTSRDQSTARDSLFNGAFGAVLTLLGIFIGGHVRL